MRGTSLEVRRKAGGRFFHCLGERDCVSFLSISPGGDEGQTTMRRAWITMSLLVHVIVERHAV